MSAQVFTLLRLVDSTIAALQKLPPKTKEDYASNFQLNAFNDHRSKTLEAVSDEKDLIPPPFAPAEGAAVVGGAKYADVMTAYAQLKVVLEANDDAPGMEITRA